jgi:hypothetical protein
MGYRSDIVALIYPDTKTKDAATEPYDALKTLMNTAFKEVTDTWNDYVEWHDDVKCLKFKIDDVKWYGPYPDVQSFMDMMKFFRDEAQGYCTEFIRIGEADDAEIHRTGSNVLYLIDIRRSIECAI